MSTVVQAVFSAAEEELVTEAVASQKAAEEVEAEAGSPYRWKAADSYHGLSQRGWTQQRIAKACGTSQQNVSFCVRCAELYYPGSKRPLFQEAYKEAQGKSVHFSSEREDWATPQDLFDVLDAEFRFKLDVCASSVTAKCEAYYSVEDDGLAQPWKGSCFMNPPYGSAIPAWVEKAWTSAQQGATVVCLVPARTDTAWWWDYCRDGEIRFLRGRLKFDNAEAGAPFPSAVVVFDRQREPDVVWWEWR